MSILFYFKVSIMVEDGHNGNKDRNKAMTLHFIVTLKTIQQLVPVTPTGMRKTPSESRTVLISRDSMQSSWDHQMTQKIRQNIDNGDTNRPRGETEMSILSLSEPEPHQ